MRTVIAALSVMLLGLLLVACNSEDGFFGPGDGNGPAGTSSAASITLLASSPQLGSNPGASVMITAIVRNGSNNLMSEVPVVFSASSGALELTSASPVTDGAGQVIALLSAGGDYTNRTITVNAVSGGASGAITVNVAGTSLSISGENLATIGDATTLTVALTDSGNNPISNRAVAITSALGNPLSASTLTTNPSGQVQVTVTANNAGTDTITATAQGATAIHNLVISGDQFQWLTPEPGAMIEIDDDVCTEIEVDWRQNGVAVNAGIVNFSATRGNLYSDDDCSIEETSVNMATTAQPGIATLYISSSNAGPSTLTAFVSGGPSTSRSVNFIATVPDSINLQANPPTIGPNNSSQPVPQESLITATVRDAANNLVANKVIRFSIVEDNSGGTLTASTATTNLQGRASTTYVSSSATTAKDGVVIRAEVDEDPSKNATVLLTVAQSALFVRLGTGNLITVPNSTTYAMPYSVIVTDANGNAATGVTVGLSVNPSDPKLIDPSSNPLSPFRGYAKGFWTHNGDNWVQVVDVDGECLNEDVNMNGILDIGEDTNGDNQLTPGNVASVPPVVTTGANGSFEFLITYPQQFAQWVHVRLTASTFVDGTESIDTQDFWLPIPASVIGAAETTPPPGQVSPFGLGVCP